MTDEFLIHDYASSADLTIDESRMSASCIFTTSTVDRVGDVVETGGIDVAEHRINPVALLDHGKYHQLPIGKTEDPDGNYTVLLFDDHGIQTTYFTKSLMGEQVFDLVVKRILRGNSLRFRPKSNAVVKRLQGGGKYIGECWLEEISWVVLPCNAECVTSLLDRGVAAGKSLHPVLKGMLMPYRLAHTSWSNGASMQKDNEQMSSIDETRGGALRKDEQQQQQQPRDEQQQEQKDDEQEQKGDDEPQGASVLRGIHEGLRGLLEHEGKMKSCEHAKVKKHCIKLLKSIKDHVGDVQDAFKEHYLEHDDYKDAGIKPLKDVEIADESTDDDEQPKDDEKKPEAKSLSMKDVEAVVTKVLNDQLSKLKSTTLDSEEMSEDDIKHLRRVEREIAQYEKWLS